MPVANTEIAQFFERYATLLEIDGANDFRVRAYRNAARTIENLPQSAAAMVADGADLSELDGIGEDLAGKVQAIVESGSFAELDEIEERLPSGLGDIEALPGVGPKRTRAIFRELGISDLDALEKAAGAGELQALDGFGAKTEQKILDAIADRGETERRFRRAVAEEMGEPLLAHIRALDGVETAEIAGSYRRRKDSVGDLDILVAAKRDSEVMAGFTSYDDVAEVVSKGSTRSTIRLRSGLQVDLRLVPAVGYGAALHYFTGSKAHNIKVRQIVVDKGLKLNEYGVFDGDERIAGKTEQEVFAIADLPWIPPELREDRGEIEAARTGELPELVTREDIRGDLHCHSDWSDGRNTLEEMAEAAQAAGHRYLAITDHSQHTRVANGLDRDRLARQIDAIDELNASFDDFVLLKASEVDILEDGTLDLDDDILARLDLRVCSIHDKFDLAEEKQTQRVLKAMDNPHFNIFAHPTGRMVAGRAGYALDMERVMRGALERGCLLEINAQPKRLDLSDVHARMAKEMGLRLAVSTDAHGTGGLGYLRFGVDQARRGWLERDDVLNTRDLTALRRLLRRG